ETTVGARLGVVSTRRHRLPTGDPGHRIEGVHTGTQALVCKAMREGPPFSAAVRAARERGYTEPDPRADLSGEDVARKLLILAREAGLRVGRDDVAVESLVPEGLECVPLDAFWERLPEGDAAWAQRLAEHAGRGEELQYVAVLEGGGIRAGIRALPAESPLAGLRGAANVVAFYTGRYAPEPLVVQGPGASADITTAVLLADIVRAAEAMR
ncbi:MAG: bifunctional aspartate kinase/homoserine dehydrogenase I, partial [Rhodothermales bacterium]|nr:bifunctional aspartate kinase/homoserine dehydrogenase I [Rhodothermales bacterium]